MPRSGSSSGSDRARDAGAPAPPSGQARRATGFPLRPAVPTALGAALVAVAAVRALPVVPVPVVVAPTDPRVAGAAEGVRVAEAAVVPAARLVAVGVLVLPRSSTPRRSSGPCSPGRRIGQGGGGGDGTGGRRRQGEVDLTEAHGALLLNGLDGGRPEPRIPVWTLPTLFERTGARQSPDSEIRRRPSVSGSWRDRVRPAGRS